MTEKVDCKFYLAINEEGDFIVTTEEDKALSELAENVGGYHGQVYEVTLKAAKAKPAVVKGELPEPTTDSVEIAVAAE